MYYIIHYSDFHNTQLMLNADFTKVKNSVFTFYNNWKVLHERTNTLCASVGTIIDLEKFNNTN